MSNLAWLADKLSRERIEQATARHLESLVQEPVQASRRNTEELLLHLRSVPGVKVRLGHTMWNEPVLVPLTELAHSCGVMTGGMGSGKTMAACAILKAIVRRLPSLHTLGFGVLDAKGELFERALYLLGQRLDTLEGREQQALLDRIVIIDFSSQEAVSPYNILVRPPYAESDFFLMSRLETLRELLPAGEKLSLRGANVLKNALALLSEFGLPLTYLDELLSSPLFQHKLVSRSRNPLVRSFFARHYKTESQATLAALRARMDSLFASESVRLALSGSIAPDFRELQNQGKIVLVNCAGATITRGVRLLLQGLVLSDIRQAIFARPNQPPVTYLWFADEAQNFFLTRQQATDVLDTLTMGRSFGTFFLFLCQSLTASVPDARILEQLHTNTRWTLTLRGTPADARFLKPALPVTGRRMRPELNPFRERSTHSVEEERSLLLEGIASLPDRTGYLWLKALSPEAIKVITEQIEMPEGQPFRSLAETLRGEPRLGVRVPRAEYEAQIEARDREWFGSETNASVRLEDAWERKYQEEARAWRP